MPIDMEDIFEAILGYRTPSSSKARKLHHLSHTPPEYWTPKERMLAGKARTRWLSEERKRAFRGGSPAILDRIWPVGPYWPNGGVLAGGESARREFRNEVGRMRYRDQARTRAHTLAYTVSPHDVLNLPASHLHALLAQGDWTQGEPNQILNDRARSRLEQTDPGHPFPFHHVGRADLHFTPQELLRNGRFGGMVGDETEEERYARELGWGRLEGPFYGPDRVPGWGGVGWEWNLDEEYRPRVFEAGNGVGGPGYWGWGG